MRSRRTRRSGGEEGFALITTVLVIALLAAFSLVVLQQTLSSTTLSKKDQSWVAALGAAQAGVDDYLSRLNDTGGGYATWSTTNPDPANPAMGFTGGAAKWAPVPTAGGEASRGSFHYDVDTTGFTGSSTVASNGNIIVSSTGRVGTRSRTITATVRRSGFVDYVYFTDLETQAPLTYSTQAARDAAVANCTAYYGTRPAAPTCTDISFSNDVLNGPVHSNDTMLICGNVAFKDATTTGSGPVAANGGKAYRTDGCASTTGTTFLRPEEPLPVKRIDLPTTNLGLKAETTAVANPRGCLYVGPTKIVIRGSQIRVTSPWTKTVTPGCAKDAFFTIPVNGVVYVDVVPAEGTPDPNSWGASEAGKPTCPAGGNGNNVGYPIPTETGWYYPCKAGDVFIEQQDGAAAHALQGRLTVSANNNLYVTNHIDYVGGTGGSSFLGLIAEQFLYVWHPVSGSTNLNLPGQATPFLDARISAALLSVNHAIMVQHPGVGAPLGTLNVTGALIQRFRGIVRTSGAAYAKNYVYDQRLRYDAPPKFLNPTISSFGAVRTAEARPQYR
jgi:type II secretory pathway pseudopilin PulG